MWIFTPPTSDHSHRIIGSMTVVTDEGVSVLKSGSTYTQKQYPTQSDFDQSDFVYQGGHVYEVTDEEAALLIAAGYSPVDV